MEDCHREDTAEARPLLWQSLRRNEPNALANGAVRPDASLGTIWSILIDFLIDFIWFNLSADRFYEQCGRFFSAIFWCNRIRSIFLTRFFWCDRLVVDFFIEQRIDLIGLTTDYVDFVDFCRFWLILIRGYRFYRFSWWMRSIFVSLIYFHRRSRWGRVGDTVRRPSAWGEVDEVKWMTSSRWGEVDAVDCGGRPGWCGRGGGVERMLFWLIGSDSRDGVEIQRAHILLFSFVTGKTGGTTSGCSWGTLTRDVVDIERTLLVDIDLERRSGYLTWTLLIWVWVERRGGLWVERYYVTGVTWKTNWTTR